MSAFWQAIQAQRRSRQPSRPQPVCCAHCGVPLLRRASELKSTAYSACSRRCSRLAGLKREETP